MHHSTSTLKGNYQAFLDQRQFPGCGDFDRNNARAISRLSARGVTTEFQLIDALPTLPPKLLSFGIWWLGRTRPPGTVRALLRLMHATPAVRLTCAHTLGMMHSRLVIREFLRIGVAQLVSQQPDPDWLDSVILGLKCCDDPAAVDILVTIFERTDLPGWLRGNAGDALGCAPQLHDRRTRLFQRAWAAAQAGLHHSDIEVVFWSMYVTMQLAQNYSEHCRRKNCRFESVLPRLHEIADTDQRLAPGFWWPMSAEAEDTIVVIETGNGPQIDAAERWQRKTEQGATVTRP